MSEWVYKATKTKVGYEDTKSFALNRNFLARSTFTEKGARPARVSKVKSGDIIHFYYRLAPKEVETIGSFRVIDGGTRFPDRFSDYVAGTALVRVKTSNLEFIRELEKDHKLDPDKGYVIDPVLKVFTGWAIEKVDDVTTPEFDQASLFPSARTTLWYYPSP
jgi:hypothetical protein